jgi:hypothetical protein
MPWELGLSDGMRGEANVAILPAAESSYDLEWSKREYLGLYRRIMYGDFEGMTQKIWMVIDHRNYEAVPLNTWLSSP